MKNNELKAWAIWALFLIVLFLAFGCKSKQASVQNLESEKQFKFEADSTIINVTKIEPSENKIAFLIPEIQTNIPNCDEVCQSKINEILSMINTDQKNGENQTKLYYDKLQKTLFLYTKLKGSIDSITKHSNIKKEYYYIKKTKTITIKTNVLTAEQKFNLWVGRIFWLLLVAIIIYKLKK